MNNLKKLREERNIKQLEVANYLKITYQGYSKIEANIKNARGSNLIKIANFFNVSVDYLLELTDDPIPLHRNQKKSSRLNNSIELKADEKELLVEILQKILKI